MPEPLDAYLNRTRRRVVDALARFLPPTPACPPLLREALSYSLLAHGKRFRPILVVAAAEAVSGHDPEAVARAMPAACALEFIHTYSLIHDDLPAMDNDTLRRGRPTSHVVFGEGLAILAGDGLLTEAFGLLAREPADADAGVAARKLRTIAIVAEAAGAAGMVGGQAIDLQAAGQVVAPNRADPRLTLDAEGLRAMHARKTGALIRAAAAAGAVMAGAPEPLVQSVTQYATELGLAFQIVDDILDVEGADAALGKTAGKDAAAGKPTYVSLFGLGAAHRLAGEALGRALDALAPLPDGSRLAQIARWVVNRTT